MLDNFSPSQCKEALSLIKDIKNKHQINKDIKIEASGGIDLETILDYAKTGVDYISVGSLTNKPRNIDLSMLIEAQK